jgi:hypothetical protein
MYVLDLLLNEEELAQFEEEERGEEWPEGEMSCPVVGCPSGDHWFQRLASYWSHYHKFHHRLATLFRCPKCHMKDIKMSDVRRHLRRIHHTTSVDGVKKETVLNTKFIDPVRGSIARRGRGPKKNADRTRLLLLCFP